MVRFLGKFSVKLTGAINTPLDAFGVGTCSTCIVCITLSARTPNKAKFWGKEACYGFMLWGGWLNWTGKSQCLGIGHCRLEKIRWIQDELLSL